VEILLRLTGELIVLNRRVIFPGLEPRHSDGSL